MNVDRQAVRFQQSLTRVCDTCMPRAGDRPHQRAVYWWSQAIADLRTASILARYGYQHCRRRRHHTRAEEDSLYAVYKGARRELQVAILRSKTAAWNEFLADLDRDPWGRPYRVIRNRYRNSAPPTESFDPALLDRIVDGLFPSQGLMAVPFTLPESEEEYDPSSIPCVTEGEMEIAVDRLRLKRKAPGPDGVHSKVLGIALDHLGGRLAGLLDCCLRQGKFPKVWKEGRLVLLRKGDRPPDLPSAYRPIVLLDEAGKLFERVLAARIVEHLDAGGPNLEDTQYGFRRGRSTVDAILTLRKSTEEAVRRGERVLAVSLDIANAFNTLPFNCILQALRYHRVPWYIRRVLTDYLQDRKILYLQKGVGHVCARRMACGVPQGSVLGPLLWNLGYDWVLRGTLLPRTSVLCYADDTLITARGSDYRRVVRLASVAATLTISRIRQLGLEVAISKTEAMVFHGPRMRPPPGNWRITVDGVRVEVKSQMRYLGLILDSRWSFKPHFAEMAPRVVRAGMALGRILPNVGGPGESCRRLYAGVLRSMALYGAPVWSDSLSRGTVALLRRPQRVAAVRAIRGYRTVSFTAATALAGMIPWELEAKVLTEVYELRTGMRDRGERLALEEVQGARRSGREMAVWVWAHQLESPVAGHRTVEAVRPVLQEWLDRPFGQLSFHLTQLLTGHGCFGKYLCRIGKEESSVCHQCGAAEDTALHTLQVCGAFASQRRTVEMALGGRGSLALPDIVAAMLESEDSWSAVAQFAADVMGIKEAAEREREDALDATPARRRRRRRRRRDADLNPP